MNLVEQDPKPVILLSPGDWLRAGRQWLRVEYVDRRRDGLGGVISPLRDIAFEVTDGQRTTRLLLHSGDTVEVCREVVS